MLIFKMLKEQQKKYKGKFPINDFVGRISEDCIINIEVQNNGVYEEEYDRFRAYGMFY